MNPASLARPTLSRTRERQLLPRSCERQRAVVFLRREPEATDRGCGRERVDRPRRTTRTNQSPLAHACRHAPSGHRASIGCWFRTLLCAVTLTLLAAAPSLAAADSAPRRGRPPETPEQIAAREKFQAETRARQALQARILDYYTLDTIPLPPGIESCDGIAFLPNGRLVACFKSGAVFTYDPAAQTWRLFAEGLHQPLGVLPLSDTEILVMQVPELTLVADRDGDGRAETFRTVSDAFGLSGNYAEFAFGPVRDAHGNLFFGLGTGSHFGRPLTNEVRGYYSEHGAWGRMTSPVPYRGWIMKVTPDGKTLPWAVGFREPNGIGLDPQGRLFAIDNQGDWVGASALYHVEEGRFYGHVPPLVWHPDFRGRQPLDTPVEELDRRRTRAAIAFPYGDMSNSPGQPTWDTTAGNFGPFAGQMFIGEMSHRRLMRAMLEEVDGVMQGAVAPFFEHESLHLGNNRLAFDRAGRLWIGQTKYAAWAGESGLQRLTWKGVAPLEVETMRLTDDGFELTFTRPVEPGTAGDPASYALKTYFYNYHERYGSAKYDLRDVAIASAAVSKDRRRVALTLANLEAWRSYDLRLTGLVSDDGAHPLVNPWLVYTVNRLRRNTPPPRAPLPLSPEEKPQRRTPSLPPGGVTPVGGPQDFE